LKVLQINTTVNSGSHGRIAEEIGRLLIENGHKSVIAYGRTALSSRSDLIRVGKKADLALHLVKTRLFDRHGFGSSHATKEFLKKIDDINPDIIHLHNLHGYYLNVKVLFKYFVKINRPLVWTFHDCWPFTGHCSHFQHINCAKWTTGCYNCPLSLSYPKSLFVDNSKMNYYQKKDLFTGINEMIIVAPSQWLAGHLKNSFLSDYEIRIINNGIDINKFKPVDSLVIRNKHNITKKYILGVASTWTEKKGLEDFKQLKNINPELDIVLVGLSMKQIHAMPPTIKAIPRTEKIEDLAALYSGAEVFINPTYSDNFPSVNLEALACGTPVITYKTGGSSESIDKKTGIVVEKGKIDRLVDAVYTILNNGKNQYTNNCRARAELLFNKDDRYNDYITLYSKILKK